MTLEAKRPQSVAFVENAQMYTLQNVQTFKKGKDKSLKVDFLCWCPH